MSRPDDRADGLGKIAGPLRLEPDEVHLWITQPGPVADAAEAARYQALLCDEERERLKQYRHAGARWTYLVARARVRTTLSRYAPVEPVDWRFTSNAYGRPEIASPAAAPPLIFNLSHTEGLVICGVTMGRALGVDVEYVPRRWPGVRLAERYFSKSEVADLLSRPEMEQRSVFFDYWTLKESYIKARGMGLAIPLDQFSFHLAAGEAPRISFGPGISDDPARWQFAQISTPSNHRVAVAMERMAGADVRLVVHETTPLGS